MATYLGWLHLLHFYRLALNTQQGSFLVDPIRYDRSEPKLINYRTGVDSSVCSQLFPTESQRGSTLIYHLVSLF